MEDDHYQGRSPMMRKVLLTAAPLLSLLATGCSDKPGTINIRETWGRSIENFGIQAVYPMREDFFVGDILLMPAVCGERQISARPQGVLVGSIGIDDLRSRFQAYYGRRPVYPGTPAAAGSNREPGQRPQPTSNEIFPSDGEVNPFDRLRIAAFPAFSVGTFAKGDVGLTSASAGLGGFLGLAGQSSSAVSVSLSQVEEVQLPAPQLLDAIYSFLSSPEAETVLNPDNMWEITEHLSLRSQGGNGCEAATPVLVFVNRVFYARSIDFDFGSDSSLAAIVGAAIERASAVEQRPSFTSPPAAAAGSSTEAPPAQAPAPNADLAKVERSADLSGAALRTLAGTQAPGFGASFAVGQYGGIVLRQSFERPLAFGVGLTYAYDLADVLTLVLERKRERATQRGLIKAQATSQARLIFVQDTPENQSSTEAEDIKRYELIIEQLKKGRLDPKPAPSGPLKNTPEAISTRPAPVPLQPSSEAITIQ
jgi:hypothetical protein